MWQIQKSADEGTTEPFIARLSAGALELRDILLNHLASCEADRTRRQNQFDNHYAPVLDAMGAARTHVKAIRQILIEHCAKVTDGLIVTHQLNAYQINETITTSLQDHFAAFLVSAVRASKLFQNLLEYMDLKIGILFQKHTQFAAGMEQLRNSGNFRLADYLVATRDGWSEVLIERRNSLEHKGWRMPNLHYVEQQDGSITVVEPDVDGQPVSEFSAVMLDRLMAFVEDMLAYAVQRSIADFGNLIDIPKDRREPSNVRRFLLGAPRLQPNETFWTLRYSESGFADS